MQRSNRRSMIFALIVIAGLAGGISFLLFSDIPVIQHTIEKPLDNARFLQ